MQREVMQQPAGAKDRACNERGHNNQMARQKAMAHQEVVVRREATRQPTRQVGGRGASRGGSIGKGVGRTVAMVG
jgi:hypothetical protein